MVRIVFRGVFDGLYERNGKRREVSAKEEAWEGKQATFKYAKINKIIWIRKIRM